MLGGMRKQFRTLLIGATAIVALGAVPACSSGGSSSEATSPATTAASAADAAAAESFPEDARYIADMPMSDGGTMTLGVAVTGDKVVAYACDGSKDEAWFFGNQDDGSLDITGKFQDNLAASYNGSDVVGDLTMNGVTYNFSAPQVPDPAGMYTASLDGVRASWVVRPDNTATGVQFTPGGDSPAFDEMNDQIQQFRERVRNKRLLQPAAELDVTDLATTINGTPVQAELVTGTTTFK